MLAVKLHFHLYLLHHICHPVLVYNIEFHCLELLKVHTCILNYLNKVKKARIITVTGSAGGREREKRPSMGKVVLEKSDYVIFTMDDPREEDVNQIIDDLVSGSPKKNYERIIDRKEAIDRALSMAQKDDIVLIAGKGRDDYMALGKEYVPYCDYDVIKSYYEQ